MENQLENEEMRQERWAQRKEEMKREKKKQELFRKTFKIGIVFIIIVVVSLTAIGIRGIGKYKGAVDNNSNLKNGQELMADASTEMKHIEAASEERSSANIAEEDDNTETQREKSQEKNRNSTSMHSISMHSILMHSILMLVNIPEPAGVLDNINVQDQIYKYTAADNMITLGD